MKHGFASVCLVAAGLGPAALMAQSPAGGAGSACPYTAGEVRTALGFEVADGRPSETPFPGGKMMACKYKGKQAMGLSVSQVQAATPAAAVQIAKGVQGAAIAGDPDSALWATAPGSMFRLGLSYVRASTHTEISVTGLNNKDSAEVAPMKSKLLKLRRLP